VGVGLLFAGGEGLAEVAQGERGGQEVTSNPLTTPIVVEQRQVHHRKHEEEPAQRPYHIKIRQHSVPIPTCDILTWVKSEI